jgi:hypothetical protein
LALMTAGFPASGQIALRNAVVTDLGIEARRQASEAALVDHPGGELGPAQLSLGFAYSIGYSDNVNFSEEEPRTDLIQKPLLTLGIALPVTPRSSMGLQVGVGYEVYWHNDDLSRWQISPDSELAYDLQVKDVLITFFDRFSYSQDVYNEPGVANRATFPRFQNIAGTQVSWVPRDFVVAGGYSYDLVQSGSSENDYINRGSHLVFGRLGHLFAEGAINTGLEVSATFTSYQNNTNDTTTVLSLGPYWEWVVTDALRARLRGGYVSYSYTTVLAGAPSEDDATFYAGFAMEHQLTDYLSHQVSVTHGVLPGAEQDTAFVVQTDVTYSIAYNFVDAATLRAGLNYVSGEQEQSQGGLAEEFDQIRIDAGIRWELTTRLALDLAYGLVVRDSNLDDRSYTRNQVTLGGAYAF